MIKTRLTKIELMRVIELEKDYSKAYKDLINIYPRSLSPLDFPDETKQKSMNEMKLKIDRIWILRDLIIGE